MSIEIMNFQIYQSKYEYSLLPEKLTIGAYFLRNRFHQLSILIKDKIILPELFIKISETSIHCLMIYSSSLEKLVTAQNYLKNVKCLTNTLKGIQSIDALLHLKWAWKPIIFTLSGLTLFALNCLNMIEHFNFLEISAIKTRLNSWPFIKNLPFGGLFTFSLIGLSATALAYSYGQKQNLQILKANIQFKKDRWSQPIDLALVKSKQEKYQNKLIQLDQKIEHNQKLLEEGEQIYQVLNCAYPISLIKVKACQKALNELHIRLTQEELLLENDQNNYLIWIKLEQKWTNIGSEDVEQFRQAKLQKWELKANCLKLRKRYLLLSAINKLMVLLKNSSILIFAILKMNLKCLMIVSLALDIFSLSCSIMSFYTKYSLQRIKISPVRLDHYFLGELLNDENEDISPISQD